MAALAQVLIPNRLADHPVLVQSDIRSGTFVDQIEEKGNMSFTSWGRA